MNINNLKIIIIVLVTLSIKCLGQKNLCEINLNPIEYVDDLSIYEDNIYCAGHTYQTEKYDGYSTDAFLNKYSDSLKLLWSLKISDSSKNYINSVMVHKKKIYALVTLGRTTNSTSEKEINLYIISKNGKIEEVINFGKSYSQPTNIVRKNNELFFGYSETNSIYYSKLNVIPVLLKYNLKTKDIKKFKGKKYDSYPMKTIISGSNIFVIGYYNKILDNKQREQFILSLENGKLNEQTLYTKKSEYFLDSYIIKNNIIVLSVFPGVYGDKEKYIKYQFIDMKNKGVNSKIISFTDLNWNEVSFDTYSTEKSTWLIIDENKTKNKYFVKISENGIKKSKIELNKKNQNLEKFIINKNIIISVVNKKLKIFKIENYSK